MRITSKGQVTIPQDIREKLGLLPHTEVEFGIDGDQAVIKRKAETNRGRLFVEHVRRFRPKLTMSSKELLAMLRDEPDELDPR